VRGAPALHKLLSVLGNSAAKVVLTGFPQKRVGAEITTSFEFGPTTPYEEIRGGSEHIDLHGASLHFVPAVAREATFSSRPALRVRSLAVATMLAVMLTIPVSTAGLLHLPASGHVNHCVALGGQWQCNVSNSTFGLPLAPTASIEADLGSPDCVRFPDFKLLVNGAVRDPTGYIWQVKILERKPELPDVVRHKVLECTTINAATKVSSPCFCEAACSGTEEACEHMPCSPTATCRCTVAYAVSELRCFPLALSANATMFSVLVFERCLSTTSHGRQRRSVSNPALPASIDLKGPRITINASGRLILRKHGLNLQANVTADKPFLLPKEIILRSGRLLVIFVGMDGQVTSDEFNIQGLQLCERINCLFCLEAVSNLDCLPPVARYVIIGSLVLLALTLVAYFRLACRATYDVLRMIFRSTVFLWRATKRVLRLGLRVGRIIGLLTRDRMQDAAVRLDALERGIPLAVLALFVIFALPTISSANMETSLCAKQSVIQSDLESCVGPVCTITRQVELSLPHLGASSCFELREAEDPAFLTAQITLDSVQCRFSTRRLYYTFETTLRVQSVFTCPYDGNCGWGSHCVAGNATTALPALQVFSSFPGGFDCSLMQPTFGSCVVLHAPGCFFYHWHLLPDYATATEVSAIDAYECIPRVQIVIETLNGTWSQTLTTDRVTHDNVSISLIGSMGGSAAWLTDKLLQPVGNSNQAFLAHAAARGSPEADVIGDVQAPSPRATDFLTTPSIKSCRAISGVLRCTHSKSPLATLTAGLGMPRTRGVHILNVRDGVLYSDLLKTPTVKLSLDLTNVGIRMLTTRVCPELLPNMTISGCYRCELPAILTVSIRSQCSEGAVRFSMEGATLTKQTSFVSLTYGLIGLPFLSEVRCPEITLCATGHSKRCAVATGCLEEADIPKLLMSQEDTLIHEGEMPGINLELPTFGFPSLSLALRTTIWVFAAICAGAVVLCAFACLVTARR
jgi:hypothetical protein